MPVSRLTAEGLASGVTAAYADAEVRLLQLMAKHLEAGHGAPDWVEAKLAELQVFRRRAAGVMSEAHRVAVNELTAATERAYLRGTAAGQGDLARLGRELDKPPEQAERAVAALIRAQSDAFEGMGPQVVRQTADAYREAVVRASAGTLTGSATRLQDAQVALDDLARRGVSGFTDTAGRRWGLPAYVDMATRTTTAQAAVRGHLDRLEQAGIPLVLVSTSSRECERCRPWEGRVLSRGPVSALQQNALTGAMESVDIDGTLDDAMRGGLFHPNCTHNVSAYVHGVTKRGDVDQGNPEGYAEKQKQRAMERNLREWKRRDAAAMTPEAERKAKAKVAEHQAKLRDHVKATGLPRKAHRERADWDGPLDGNPVDAPSPVVALADVDGDVIEAELGELMAAGDYGDRFTELSAELDRRDGFTAVLPDGPDPVAEQTILRNAWGENIAADRALGNLDRLEAEQNEGGRFAGRTIREQREEYDTWAYTQWLRAEEETRGNLLSKDGVRASFDSARFFDGSARPVQIRKYAAEELLRWFADNPRMSFDEYRAINGGTGASARAARERLKGRTLSEFG